MPIEVNWLRDYKGGDPERFREYQRKRYRPVEWVDDVLALDEKWRQAVSKRQDINKAINKLQKDVISKKMKAKQPCDDEIAQVSSMKKEVKKNIIEVSLFLCFFSCLLLHLFQKGW